MLPYLVKKRLLRQPTEATATVDTLPAPVGGWNVRDARTAMKDNDAITLDNLIPDLGSIRLRNGYLPFSTGLGGAILSLMEYAPASGSAKMFAATATSVFDASLAGPVGAAVLTGKTSGAWAHTMLSNSGGNFLCMVNGADGYWTYNGATFTDQSAAVTGLPAGVTAARFAHVNLHQRRLWFVDRSSNNLYYLGTDAISGAAQAFPVGGLLRRGGNILCTATWTKDAGDGMDDLLAIITDRGEVVVYAGTDPATAATWGLVGVFTIAEPIGRRCMIKVGGDLGIITSAGVALLSQLITANRSGQSKLAITDKINGAFRDAYTNQANTFGWIVTEYPRESLVLVNVPQGQNLFHQYVMNTKTGAWCRFRDINTQVWSLYGRDLYFGGLDGTVYRYGDDYDDNGVAIEWQYQTAFSRMSSQRTKSVSMVRCYTIASEGFVPSVDVKTDYDTTPPNISGATADSGAGAAWDLSDWDITEWSASLSVKQALWQSVNGEGTAISVAAKGSGRGLRFEFNMIDVCYEGGGVL